MMPARGKNHVLVMSFFKQFGRCWHMLFHMLVLIDNNILGAVPSGKNFSIFALRRQSPANRLHFADDRRPSSIFAFVSPSHFAVEISDGRHGRPYGDGRPHFALRRNQGENRKIFALGRNQGDGRPYFELG